MGPAVAGRPRAAAGRTLRRHRLRHLSSPTAGTCVRAAGSCWPTWRVDVKLAVCSRFYDGPVTETLPPVDIDLFDVERLLLTEGAEPPLAPQDAEARDRVWDMAVR